MARHDFIKKVLTCLDFEVNVIKHFRIFMMCGSKAKAVNVLWALDLSKLLIPLECSDLVCQWPLCSAGSCIVSLHSSFTFISLCTLLKNSPSSFLKTLSVQQLLQGLLLWKHLSRLLQEGPSHTEVDAVYYTLSHGIDKVTVWLMECIPACGTEQTLLFPQLPQSNFSVFLFLPVRSKKCQFVCV